MSQRRTVSLRGYTKKIGPDRYVAVCLTLNLVVHGRTAADAREQLDALENAYLRDAVANDEWDAFVPRRAPVSFYVEYVKAWFLSMFRGIGSTLQVFKDRRPYQAHA